MSSPTQRSLKLLRDTGYSADVVERYNSFTKRRHDMFGFGDVFAFRDGEFAIVQTTSASNFSARMKKIKANEFARDWLNAGGVIIVHGWGKKKDGKWRCREETLVKGDL